MPADSESENDTFEAPYGKFGEGIPSFDLSLYQPDMHQSSKPSILLIRDGIFHIEFMYST